MLPGFGGGAAGMRRNMLTLQIRSDEDLYKSYLPFLKHGGLFIPTDKLYQLGDEVFLLLTLPDSDKTPVAGKVVWINPKGSPGGRPAGIGIHFGELDKGATRDKIEQRLVEKLRWDRPTYTM